MTAANYVGYIQLMDVINRYHYEAVPDVFLPPAMPFRTQHEYSQLLQEDDRHFIGA